MRNPALSVGLTLSLAAQALAAREKAPSDFALEAGRFVRMYSSVMAGVSAVSSEASWTASTDATPAHEAARAAAGKALAAVTGNPFVIQETRRFLARKDDLPPQTARELQKMLLAAAEAPGTLPEAAAARVELERKESALLDSFQFCLERKGRACAKPATANGIDDILRTSRDLSERRRAWEASKETGPALKPGLVELRRLRNQVARHFGFSSFYALQVADYGMTVPEMSAMLEGFLRDIQPLYKELHCWAKNELAKRYGQPPPRKRIPAHWITDRWSQSWPSLVEGAELDPLFQNKPPEWIVRQAEKFYLSMGFPKLPEGFWSQSDLYPVPPGSARSKNARASAWHMDLDRDVRSLMNVKPDAEWFSTAHHELGHIYYYLAYSRPEVPVLLRAGANRAFHEGIGELIGLASMQVPYLREAGILPRSAQIDRTRWLLNEALTETVAFLPWSAGVMASWERDLYESDLPPKKWNSRWWDYVAKYQGVDPPTPRGQELCDGCTKTHVIDDPAQYYDYAIATVLKYQLHGHICRNILKQDPRSCDYFGSKDAGRFLQGLLSEGATRDWRELLREKTGQDLSAKPMLDYFAPLSEYLRKENAGRTCSWP